jgi:hypothetical protein
MTAETPEVGSRWRFRRTGIECEVIRHTHKQSRCEVEPGDGRRRFSYLYLVIRSERGVDHMSPDILLRNADRIES